MSDATSPETREAAARIVADAMGGRGAQPTPSPLLAASTEQLAAALLDALYYCLPDGLEDGIARSAAASLIASGAVVPAASLADDEALVERVHAKVYDQPRYYPTSTADILRALAAALEDR